MTIVLVVVGLISALAVLTFIGTKLIEHKFPAVGEIVTVPGGAVHVVETAPKGPQRGVVLLVHGASGNFADLHEALADRLADEGFRCFAVDRPGHGWSMRFERRAKFWPQSQARMLRAALEAKGVSSAYVVVHSLGGVLGLALTLEAPKFVRGLLLLSPVSHPWPGGVSYYYSLAAAPFLGSLFRHLLVMPIGFAAMSKSLSGVFSPGAVPPNYVRRTRLPLMLRPRHFQANATDVVDAYENVVALSHRYNDISVPTAVLTGDKDAIVYAHIHSEGCKRDIAGATLTVLPSVGHSPHYADPEAVIATFLDLVRRSEPTAILDRQITHLSRSR